MSLYQINITKSIKWDAGNNLNGLISGMRGSGKTFLALALMVELCTLPMRDTASLLGSTLLPTQIFAIDVKNASVGRLKRLPSMKERVATAKVEALKLLDHYLDLMFKRIDFINKFDFGETATSLQMPLYYLLLDEFSATNALFNDATSKEDKQMKYHWNADLRKLMLTNRLPGFGIFIISQQTSVGNSGIGSDLQQECGFKCYMGSAPMSEYRLTFGNEVNVPDMHLGIGQGFLWKQGLVTSGYVLPFSAPQIDKSNFWGILKSAMKLQDDKYLTYSLRQDIRNT